MLLRKFLPVAALCCALGLAACAPKTDLTGAGSAARRQATEAAQGAAAAPAGVTPQPTPPPTDTALSNEDGRAERGRAEREAREGAPAEVVADDDLSKGDD